MGNIELPVLRRQAMEGNKRLRRIVPLITAAALSASLIAGAAGPAGAAVRQPARPAPISLVSSDNALPAESLTAAARYVHVSDGRLTLDTLNAEKAGVGSEALSAGITLVARLNKLLDHETLTADSAGHGGGVEAANAAPAAARDTSITILPGITLTIDNTGIQLSLTKQAVTEVENVLGFGQSVASLVGSILSVIPIQGVSSGGPIAGIVAASLGLANGLLKLCTAPDGSATFTISWFGLPSCSGLSLFA